MLKGFPGNIAFLLICVFGVSQFYVGDLGRVQGADVTFGPFPQTVQGPK